MLVLVVSDSATVLFYADYKDRVKKGSRGDNGNNDN